jgi:hypothetical protein
VNEAVDKADVLTVHDEQADALRYDANRKRGFATAISMHFFSLIYKICLSLSTTA